MGKQATRLLVISLVIDEEQRRRVRREWIKKKKRVKAYLKILIDLIETRQEVD